MFERYSEQARRVLFFARAVVSELGSPQIEPEHVLLGMIRDAEKAPGDFVFKKFDLDTAALEAAIESRIERKSRFDESVEVPFSRLSRRVLIAAAEEANRLEHQVTGPEHLLLGLLRVTDSVPASILGKHGLTIDRAREIIAADRNPPSS
jgi:ATP-dependent Clp protease ATP-binding subunit ClpC